MRERERERERERAGKLRERERGRRKCKGGGRAGQKGLKKEREKDAGSEEAEAERVKDGEVGQVRSDVDSDAAKTRPRTEGGRMRGEDVCRTCAKPNVHTGLALQIRGVPFWKGG
ncbi:uncharacterized protein LOC116731590, partial [Lates japonicus]